MLEEPEEVYEYYTLKNFGLIYEVTEVNNRFNTTFLSSNSS